MSRQLSRNNGIYRGVLQRFATYVVGNGFRYQAHTTDVAWNQAAEKLWRAWWMRPEANRTRLGCQVGQMVATELATCGDMACIMLGSGRIQLIESEQIASTIVPDGLIRDADGQPTGLLISRWDEHGMLRKEQAHSYALDTQAVFLVDPERPSGTRGVPPMQSSFSMLHRINDVADAEALAWQLLARFAVSISREGASEDAYLSSREDTERGSDTDGGDISNRVTELDMGLIFHGAPGETVRGVERNVPGKDFGASMATFLRLLGLPLGMPLELVALDWTKSNYSQSRAVIEQARVTFQRWQELIEAGFFRPICEWLIGRWVATGALADREDALVMSFDRPSFPWIDQLKEAQAYSLRVERGFLPQRAVCRALNVDRDDVVAERDMEIRDAIARAQAIEADTGVLPPWEVFAGLPIPSSAPAAPSQEAASNEADREDRREREDAKDQEEDADV